MDDPQDYRIIARPKAMLIAAVVLAIGAIAVWAGMLWIESYGERISVLQALSPDAAATELAGDLRTFAIVSLLVLVAIAAMLVWYSVRGLHSQSMPPVGAWVIEGQRIRRGRAAVTAAWIVLVAAALLTLFACVFALLVWQIADTV